MRGDINFCKGKIKEFLELEEGKIKNLGLKNPIDYFKVFKFSDLINKNEYRVDKYKSFITQTDEDAMPLAKFIYFVLWSEDMPNNEYSLESLRDNAYDINYGEIYGSETINTYVSLFGEFCKEETEYKAKNLPKIKKIFDTDEELCDKIDKFLDKCFTIGNFMLLPKDKKFENQTLNQRKGMKSNGFFDFADLFYYDLFNSKLNEKCQLATNDFCKNNFLEDYFNIEGEEYKPKKVFLHDEYRQKGLTKGFISNYVTEATRIIESRSERICNILKERLKD